MKKIILTLIFCCCCFNGFAQSEFSAEKTVVIEEDNERRKLDFDDKSHKLRLWIPAFTFDVVSWFVDKKENCEEKQMLKSLGNVSLFLLTNTDVSHKKVKRYQRKLDRKISRRGGEELVVVETPEATINIKAMFNRKGEMKKAIVFVDAEDTLLFAKVGGTLDVNSLMKLIND